MWTHRLNQLHRLEYTGLGEIQRLSLYGWLIFGDRLSAKHLNVLFRCEVRILTASEMQFCSQLKNYR